MSPLELLTTGTEPPNIIKIVTNNIKCHIYEEQNTIGIYVTVNRQDFSWDSDPPAPPIFFFLYIYYFLKIFIFICACA